MSIWEFIFKVLFIFATISFMALPFLMEYFTFKRDTSPKSDDKSSLENEKKQVNIYKRFKVLLYTVIYMIAVTIAMYFLKEFILWIEQLSFIKNIAGKLSLDSRVVYFAKVIVAILVNVALGLMFWSSSKFARIGFKKKNIFAKKKKNGDYSWFRKKEIAFIQLFNNETWFFVSHVLKWFNIILSSIYALLFIEYQIPALFGADWIPYDFISMLFDAGYIYPVITLLGLWEMYFFLAGFKKFENECPGFFNGDNKINLKKIEVDLKELEKKLSESEQFKNFYVCNFDVSGMVHNDVEVRTDYHNITKAIAKAVENDKRNPKTCKKVYLDCIDKLAKDDKGILINGSLFSDFSVYFLRYLSAVVARGDTVVFVCNNKEQIDAVYDHLNQGLSELSSLYCKEFSKKESEGFDDPIWKIVKIGGTINKSENIRLCENTILVTSLEHLCSDSFDESYGKFISLTDVIVFVDTLETANKFNRQLSTLDARLKHIIRKNLINLRDAKKENKKSIAARYTSRQIRYVCFDDTKTAGLDKVLENIFSLERIDSCDIMKYSSNLIVSCYQLEGIPCQLYGEDLIDVVMNMGLMCLCDGITNVKVFADDIIPYENYVESIKSNGSHFPFNNEDLEKAINKHFYNPSSYSVIIAVNSKDTLPDTIRKYASMVSDDTPTLLIVFSRPYLLRNYYLNNAITIWDQIVRVPVQEGTKEDIAQKILVQANESGISKSEVLELASKVPYFKVHAQNGNVDAILRDVIKIYGESDSNIFDYFEYSLSQDFSGKNFDTEIKIKLCKKGPLFEKINGQDKIIMVTDDSRITLPISRNRLTQNFIAGQNFVYDGKTYYIRNIDAENGFINVKLTHSGANDEVYKYIQKRYYHVEDDPSKCESLLSPKEGIIGREKDNIRVDSVCLSAFRAPMEVFTNSYFEITPYLFTIGKEIPINDFSNFELSKQTYRRYGQMSNPKGIYEGSITGAKGATIMSIRIFGKFGPDINKTLLLSSVMLNEVLHLMFPSVADSLVVCPVLHKKQVIESNDIQQIIRTQPQISLTDRNKEDSDSVFEFMIIEDCSDDLGVVSSLISAGNDVLEDLFKPIFNYLQWYASSQTKKDDYLYFGLDHEPDCFDFVSLLNLSELLVGNRGKAKFVDLEGFVEYEVCDFCGKRYARYGAIHELDDGRKICDDCAHNLVGNDDKLAEEQFDRAKIFLEDTYGIKIDDDWEFCFEPTSKIVNTLKQKHGLIQRGHDVPLKFYIDNPDDKDGKKKNKKGRVHIENSIPPSNLSELLVREMTHIWQLKHLPNLSEELAEGHIALVSVQYLRFLRQDSLAAVRATYYESTRNISGEGYRKLVKALKENPQYNNNPFRYLIEITEGESDDIIPMPTIAELSDYGARYVPKEPDRALDGNIVYFYYSRLNDNFKKTYDSILGAIQNHEDHVRVEGVTGEDIIKIAESVEYDHPELFWYKRAYLDNSGENVAILYGASKEEADNLQKRIDAAIPEYLKDIDDSMSAYDVAIRLHVKIISMVDYDTIALNREKSNYGPDEDKIDYLRTICGVFINGKAVCEGYARAMQYLLQKCGVECAEVAGRIRNKNGDKGGGHAWNILKVDGEYYHLDATWDDRSDTVQTVKNNDFGFDYFCITDEELKRTRYTDLCPTDLPHCDATSANYFYHNNLILESYDLRVIEKMAAQEAKAAKKNQKESGLISFKCATKEVYDETFDSLFNSFDDRRKLIESNKQASSITLKSNPDIWTITIKFKYKSK